MRTRDKRLELRLTEQELTAVKKQVEKSGLSQTDFALAAMLNKPITVIEDMPEVIRQLKGIGNNLNQITRAVNAGHAAPVPAVTALQEEVLDLWRLLRRLKAAAR